MSSQYIVKFVLRTALLRIPRLADRYGNFLRRTPFRLGKHPAQDRKIGGV